MLFGLLTSAGMLLSLIGAVMLYRSTPFPSGDQTWNDLRAIPTRAEILRRHRRAWGLLGFGFLLQLIGSLGWIIPAAGVETEGVLTLILTL
jgi:hypothetical protein